MKIIIDNLSFEISEPFQPGPTTLDLGTAQTLNALRADRIREATRKRLQAKSASTDFASVQEVVAEIDATYTFKPRREGPLRVSRLEIEVAKVAEEQVAIEYRRLGREPEGPEFESLILAFMDLSAVKEEASRRLQAGKAVAEEALEDLLQGDNL